MLKALRVRGFAAVPYLEDSALMRSRAGTLTFSLERPNVVVGPNGSGKSALITALAIRYLTYFSDRSAFDRKYLLDVEARTWWSRGGTRGEEFVWLAGFDCETDNAPALYYRPGHVPGNEPTIADAMMGVYWEQAKAYARLVERKSAGEQNQAVLDSLLDAIDGRDLPKEYAYMNWEFGPSPADARRRHDLEDPPDMMPKARALEAALRPARGGVPLILMDEPEQSLDALAEARIWAHVARSDCRSVQMIIATHSLYPMMHRDRFHLIETQPGYVDDVLGLLG
jgi:hypothetical protein